MKKVYILVGAVLLLVLILMCWLFIFHYYDFATDVGKKSDKASLNEKSRFIGTWETEFIEGDSRFIGTNGIYVFNSGGTGSIGGLPSTWDIDEGQLIIYYNEGLSFVTYGYSFADDDNTLILTKSGVYLEFTRIIN